MLRKTLRIQRGRSDDELQIGTARQQTLEIAQQKIDIERALVRLVDNDGVVIFQQRIVVYFGQQDAVGHQLDAGVGRHLVVEAHLVADQPAEFGFQFMRDTRRHRACRHPARLGMADHAQHTASQTQADFRQLRGLPRTGLAAHDNHLVLFNRLCQLLAPCHHRQVGGIFDS